MFIAYSSIHVGQSDIRTRNVGRVPQAHIFNSHGYCISFYWNMSRHFSNKIHFSSANTFVMHKTAARLTRSYYRIAVTLTHGSQVLNVWSAVLIVLVLYIYSLVFFRHIYFNVRVKTAVSLRYTDGNGCHAWITS